MIRFVELFAEIFSAGGPLMLPLVALAVYMYFCGFQICFKISSLNVICADTARFRRAYAEFISTDATVLDTPQRAFADIKSGFARLRVELLSGLDRRLKMLKLLSGIAPLIGLLGTVSGMMTSIASAARTTGGVADGISTALITTQAGLVAAIPAWIIAMAASALAQKLLINVARREVEMIGDAVK